MLLPRTAFGAATGPDGRIYAIGGKIGFDSKGFLVTNTVEAYSPSTNSWTFVASTPDLYDNVRAVTGSDGKIYATNGSKLDAYDTATDTWTQLAAPSRLIYPEAFCLGNDGRLYLIQGMDPF